MSRHNEIQNACRSLGKDAAFYDGMITCSTLPGRVICGLVWNMGKAMNIMNIVFVRSIRQI